MVSVPDTARVDASSPERRDWPALRDTLIWFGLIAVSGYSGYRWWGSAWAVIPFALYRVLYASSSDSRWHEAGPGTAFKTDWMNSALYEIASFMVMRESTVWRWSHTRHHSDTIIVGRDPEIAVPRPPNLVGIGLSFFNLGASRKYFRQLFNHAARRMLNDEKTYVPANEYPRVFFTARVHLLIYVGVTSLAVFIHSMLPLMFVGLPNLYGSWLMIVYGKTQHAGLAENVLDHRLNCRTVYLSSLNRYLYWNMNYHVEHHMFPLVPYHALPELHAAVRFDMPVPYSGLWNAYREIVPTILRQVKDPGYHIRRRLPSPLTPAEIASEASNLCASPDSDGWLDAGPATHLCKEDVMRVDCGRKTFALYRDAEGKLYATSGICTHGNTHLAEGYVKGKIIECPKHNGRFNLSDGSPARPPACRGLVTYPIEEMQSGRLRLNIARPAGVGARAQLTHYLRVVSSRSVATFIREIELEHVDSTSSFAFIPGDYLQIDIPPYNAICYRQFDIPAPYAAVWEAQHLFDLVARNPTPGRRNNYSIASNQSTERVLRLNVRIATPPPGQDCAPGIGSAYIFNLRPGDMISAIGPFGDFHVKPTQREAVYIGGGAGMAPLRAHLTHLFETQLTARRVSFWFGARCRQELFYQEYFVDLASRHPNFTFHPALSSPLPTDEWAGLQGFIHEVALRCYLRDHPRPDTVEYYLCGPPQMIKACTKMLTTLRVSLAQIAYDEF